MRLLGCGRFRLSLVGGLRGGGRFGLRLLGYRRFRLSFLRGHCGCGRSSRRRSELILGFGLRRWYRAFPSFELSFYLLRHADDFSAFAEDVAHALALVARAAQAEAEAVAVTLDAYDLEREQVALADDVARVADAAVDKLRDVDQALHGPFDPRERAEGDQLRYQTGDHLALLVFVDDGLPLLGVGPPEAERDLLVFRVDLRDVDVDFVANLEQLRGRLVAVP